LGFGDLPFFARVLQFLRRRLLCLFSHTSRIPENFDGGQEEFADMI
jgi:hypothetical protein